MKKKEIVKKAALVGVGFVAGAVAMNVYRNFIEDHIPYSYRGNVIENAFYFLGRDTLDMLCAENASEWFDAMRKELKRR